MYYISVFAFQKLVVWRFGETIYLLITLNKTKYFLWNIKNTDRNDVHEQSREKHTTHREKHNCRKA